MSCNGCRVLRKGCSENCCIRPCIQWINNPEAEGNATLFLAKFYGRAGLINLIESGPQQQRPALFRSLLYEACGRIVNPIYGSVGLVCSGSWNICEQAVDAVLRGAPIAAIPNFRAYDIRHVPKGPEPAIVVRNGARFRHSTRQTGPTQLIDAEVTVEASKVIHIAGDQKEMEAKEKDSGLNLTLRLALPSA